LKAIPGFYYKNPDKNPEFLRNTINIAFQMGRVPVKITEVSLCKKGGFISIVVKYDNKEITYFEPECSCQGEPPEKLVC